MNTLEYRCEKTSFHGLHFVREMNATSIQKWFWIFIFLAGVGGFAFLSYNTIEDFLSKNTKI